jgi:hypothetical protein
MMSTFNNPLKNIRIASPCSADWDQMYGDDRKRFCGDCKLNVYNLSGMTREEAEALIINAEGRLCVRFYKRRDGSVITQDCPVGWARIKQRTKVYATAVFSLVMAIFSGVFIVSPFSRPKSTMGELKIPFTTPTPQHTMGAIAIRPDSNSNTSQTPANAADDHDVDQIMGKMRVIPPRYRG